MNKEELTKKEMLSINGGSLSSSILNAIVNAVNIVYELGKETGSALRRLLIGDYCPLN